MSEINMEQWERRKWYLIRSLFDEDPKSSPIPERQELTPPSEVTINRPLSPLPNLIIEKVPNRHDEPDEFYQKFQKVTMELYRNLFPNRENFSQCSEQPRNSDETNNSVSQFIEQHCYDSKNNEVPENCPTEDMSCEEDQSYEDITNEIQNKKNLTDSTMLRSTTPESHNDEIIVTQALVHQVNDEEADREISHVANTSINLGEIEEQSEDEPIQTDLEDSSFSNSEQLRVFEDTDRRVETGCGTNASSSPQVPEIMRRQETSNDSVQSFKALDFGRHFSAHFSGDKRFETASVRALEEAEVASYDSSVILAMTSTPRIPKKLNAVRKRRISPENRPSLTKKKYKYITTPTSFSSSDAEGTDRRLETGCGTNASSSPQEPEIMRRQETNNDSVQSINALEFGRAMNSTLTIPRKLNPDRKRRITSENRPSLTKKKYENIATQTSFSSSDAEGTDRRLETGCGTNASSSPQEPEIMRRQETNNDSVQSINALEFGRAMNSTLTIPRKLNPDRKRRITSENRPSLTKKKYENIATQTSFSSSDAEGTDRRVETGCGTNANSLPQEPEIMRRQETNNDSVQSINALDFGRATTSTPRILRKLNAHRKRRISSENRPSRTKKKYENITTQTSFSSSDAEDKLEINWRNKLEINWRKVLEHFLKGNLRSYKLCSCKNHTCC